MDGLQSLSKLSVLDLSRNALSGTIPQLSNLKSLDVKSNGLMGTLESVAILKNLERLNVEDNNLTMPPGGLLFLSTQLKEVNLTNSGLENGFISVQTNIQCTAPCGLSFNNGITCQNCPAPPKNMNVTAIAIGIVGGILLLVIASVFVCRFRHKRQPAKPTIVQVEREPITEQRPRERSASPKTQQTREDIVENSLKQYTLSIQSNDQPILQRSIEEWRQEEERTWAMEMRSRPKSKYIKDMEPNSLETIEKLFEDIGLNPSDMYDPKEVYFITQEEEKNEILSSKNGSSIITIQTKKTLSMQTKVPLRTPSMISSTWSQLDVSEFGWEDHQVCYEVKIIKLQRGRALALGFATAPYPPHILPGLEPNSFAIWSDGTKHMNYLHSSEPFCESFGPGDVVGVGYRVRIMADVCRVSFFVTLNGRKLGDAYSNVLVLFHPLHIYPTIGTNGHAVLSLNVGL
ncbi:hypothetical protein EDD86DRAFT_215043 [Gorgonomyces haynaldii]|nr:hypothetical protein EDD86DRAFT_215043 [Gorgonomyces haynaldii]